MRPFFLIRSGHAFDWGLLDQSRSPAPLHKAVLAALASGGNAEFCAALPILEDFLSKEPDLKSVADGSDWAVPADVFRGPLPPPVRPNNFICIGLNYRDHASEAKMELPARPLLFAKSSSATSGHNLPVRLPAGCQQLDYEAELAVVIGRRCRGVRASEALSYVAGYTCANDISARDFQFADGQWFRGKSCDGFGPLGPWLVTPQEVGDPHALPIRCRLNDRIMQDSTTQNLIFNVAELIEFISGVMTLEPGDVISTGTSPGVGFARKPPVYLHEGDIVEVEIERIGVLRNTITAQGGKPS